MWKNVNTNSDTCSSVFTGAQFTVAKKKATQVLISRQINKMWHVYIAEYYSAIKMNEILSLGAIWMDLQTVMLSELSQRKTRTVLYHLYLESKK